MTLTVQMRKKLKSINVKNYMSSNIHKNRSRRDLHFLNQDGMVACNPRDREAAHRAEMEGIATEDIEAVTCVKCWNVIRREKDRISSRDASADH